jgi:hypothetical protein
MLQRVPSAAAMLQLGAHLAQCSLQQDLQLAARQLSTQQLASAARQRQPTTPADGAVLHLSPADAASQFLLGGYAGRAWSPDGRQLLALRIPEGPAQPASMRMEIGVFERQPGVPCLHMTAAQVIGVTSGLPAKCALQHSIVAGSDGSFVPLVCRRRLAVGAAE